MKKNEKTNPLRIQQIMQQIIVIALVFIRPVLQGNRDFAKPCRAITKFLRLPVSQHTVEPVNPEAVMHIRNARSEDAEEISTMLQRLTDLGKRNIPSDGGFVHDHYITHPDTIQCSLALDDQGTIVGLQILKYASDGNEYGVTPGWGIIGTHVSPDAARRGVGRKLFTATCTAARNAGLRNIDATIGASNAEGLGYYDAMGFVTYDNSDDRTRKRYDVKT